MQQMAHPVATGVYAQPITDLLGALIARVATPVAAYNWLVLLTFPFAAVAAFALARHLGLSPPGATFVAFAFAFSPFHLAHAAYHPQVAQVQWIPLYFLVLFRALDDATPTRLAMLGVGAIAVTFSNFYGGLIAAVMTPFAMATYWQSRQRSVPQGHRNVVRILAMFGAVGIAAAA